MPPNRHAGLAKRLTAAATTLAALTPPRGRGKRHSTDEATLVGAMDTVLTAHRVEGLLRLTGEKQRERTTPYVGRGRGAASREQRVIKQTRSHMPPIARPEDNIAALTPQFGGQALVTNAGQKRLSLQEAVLGYRHADRVARICNRLTSRVHIAPLLVKRNDQIEGLTSLRTRGVRVLTVRAFGRRRSLGTAQATLPGLHPAHTHTRTDKPTAERLLQACAAVSLTIIKHAVGEVLLRRLTPLSGVQEDILQRLGVGASLYRQLDIQNIES